MLRQCAAEARQLQQEAAGLGRRSAAERLAWRTRVQVLHALLEARQAHVEQWLARAGQGEQDQEQGHRSQEGPLLLLPSDPPQAVAMMQQW